MIKKYFLPDNYYENIFCVTTELLSNHGIKGIICDIDNTLEPYEVEAPSEKVLDWLKEINQAGISISFVSNNNKERVSKFNSKLKFFASANSRKPFSKQILKAMDHMGTDKTNTAIIGDQIFTDIFAGKKIGLYSILIKPINDKKSLFFKFKRKLEKIIMKNMN